MAREKVRSQTCGWCVKVWVGCRDHNSAACLRCKVLFKFQIHHHYLKSLIFDFSGKIRRPGECSLKLLRTQFICHRSLPSAATLASFISLLAGLLGPLELQIPVWLGLGNLVSTYVLFMNCFWKQSRVPRSLNGSCSFQHWSRIVLGSVQSLKEQGCAKPWHTLPGRRESDSGLRLKTGTLKPGVLFLKLNLVGMSLLYHVEWVSAVQQSESVIRIRVHPSFWISFPLGHHRALSGVPCAIQ